MKYIEVTKHVAGRTITQRYPARSVGKRPSCALGAVDFTCLECGYIVCKCSDGGWPPPIAPEPDVLRAGWVIRGTFMGEPDHWFGDFNVCSSDGGDGDWSVCNERGHELSQHPTLEAAMQRAEALARGES